MPGVGGTPGVSCAPRHDRPMDGLVPPDYRHRDPGGSMRHLLLRATVPLLAGTGCFPIVVDARTDANDTSSDDTGSGPRDTGLGFGECTTAAACDFGEICLRRSCTEAFDRKYFVSVRDIKVATKNYQGEAWDPGGGAPDLVWGFGMIVNGELDTSRACTSEPVEDEFEATWNLGCELLFRSGDHFRIVILDSDVDEPDQVGSFEAQGKDELLELLSSHSQDLEISNDVFRMRIRVDPTF